MPKEDQVQPGKNAAQPANQDSQILSDGPGQESSGVSAVSPDLTEIEFGGRKVQLTREDAEAFQQHQRKRESDFDKKLNEQAAELGELRKKWQSVQQTVQPPAQQKPSWATRMFEDPDGFARDYANEIEQRLEQKFLAHKQDEEAWKFFVKHNPDLEEERHYVEMTLRQNGHALTGLAPVDLAKKLGDITRSELLRVVRKFNQSSGSDEELPHDRAIVEGGGSPAPKRKAPEEPEIGTLSDVIRAGRKRRLQPTAPKG